MKQDLTNLSDNELVALSKTNSEALETLFNRYKIMLNSICRSYYLINGDDDDVMQEGMIGLFKAINTFDNNYVFSSYAYKCIKNSIITAIKKSNTDKNKPLNNFISLSGSDDDDMDKSVIVSSGLNFNPESTFINSENEKELRNKIETMLTPLEFEILKQYLDGFSYVDIAKRLDKNTKSVDNAIQRIRKKLSELKNGEK